MYPCQHMLFRLQSQIVSRFGVCLCIQKASRPATTSHTYPGPLLPCSPATAFMTKCQRSCVGKPYSPTCVAWTFEGSRSAVFENGCFANCMLQVGGGAPA